MKTAKNILFWASTAVLVIAIVLLAAPKLFGVEFRAVLTGSMTPEIPVGSLVVIVPSKAENINVGDDITFVTKGNLVVTHRVVSIDRDKNEFTTWGIANGPDAIDGPNSYENIIGVVKLKFPVLGFIFSWLSTTKGKVACIAAIVVFYLLSNIIDILLKDRKDSKNSMLGAKH